MTEKQLARAMKMASAYQRERFENGSYADQEEPYIEGYTQALKDFELWLKQYLVAGTVMNGNIACDCYLVPEFQRVRSHFIKDKK